MHPTTAIRPIPSLLIASTMSLAIACSPSGGDKAAPAAATPAPGGTAAPAAAPPAPATAAGPTLNVRIEGANAHVISLKHNSLEFGPMKGGGVCGNDEPHELWLLVPDTLKVTANLPEVTSPEYATFKVYRLTGLQGSLDVADAARPTLPPLAVPDSKDQLSLIPDLAQLAPDPRLDPGWRNKLSARFTLRGGALSVKEPEEPPARTAIWEFKAPGRGATGLAQNITDHLSYTRPLPSPRVTLKFDGGKAVTVEGSMVNLRLLTATESAVMTQQGSAAYQIGEAAHEYCRFYDILQAPPAMKDRPLPILRSVALAGGTSAGPRPGKYCGGARFVEHE